MAYIVKVDSKEFRVDLKREGNNFRMYLDGEERFAEVVHEEGSQMTLIIDNKPFRIILASNEHVMVNDQVYSIEIVDEQIGRLIKVGPEKAHKKEMAIKSPMPGLIIEIGVKEGDSVKHDQGLIVVEAMKMQNEMKAPKDGVVKKILVAKGQTVNSGDTLIIIE